MNLLNKNTAKFYASLFFLIVMTVISQRSQAQKQYTTISKNINPEAQNLYHDLSPQGDSLYLKAESIFYKVTFLNSLDRKVYTFNPPVVETSISLQDIIVGDYTVLVYKKDRIIVFHISRLLEIEPPIQLIASKEMSVSQEASIVSPVITKVNLKEKSASKVVTHEIKLEDNFELALEDLKVAVNDDKLKIDKSDVLSHPRPYNLSSPDRSNMESREAYRRNNLRPNGKPYY
ncbi:MAG: hypothetical protein ACSHXF_16620 [Aquaticitalea sp.]